VTAVGALREKECRWAQAREQLARTAELLDLDVGTHRMLAIPRTSVEVSLPIRSGDREVVVFQGYRVLHSSKRGPGKDGLRYDPAASLDETKALAMRNRR
jgi:glutamate dehydrogenase (NAD(P)+)